MGGSVGGALQPNPALERTPTGRHACLRIPRLSSEDPLAEQGAPPFDQRQRHLAFLAGDRQDFPDATMDPNWGVHRWADGTQVPIYRHGPADDEHLVVFWAVRGLQLKCELHAQNAEELRRYQPAFEALLDSVRFE